MIGCTFLLVLFIIEPWLFLTGLSGAYLFSILFSVQKWRKLESAVGQKRQLIIRA